MTAVVRHHIREEESERFSALHHGNLNRAPGAQIAHRKDQLAGQLEAAGSWAT